MPAAASEASRLLQPVPCDGAVGDDGGARARPQRGDARAQRWQHVAADDDVIGAIAERDVDGDRIGMFQRRGHGVALIAVRCCSLAAAQPRVQGLEAFVDDLVVRHVARPDRQVGVADRPARARRADGSTVAAGSAVCSSGRSARRLTGA